MALGTCALLLGSCATSEQAGSAASESADTSRTVASVAAPLDAEGRFETIWSYLLDRHDTNRDGVVDKSEYSRAQFERLDRDGDGLLTETDFERPVGLMDPRRMNAMRAQAIVGRYFQVDHDLDLDGALLEAEFRAAASAVDAALPEDGSGVMAVLMEDTDPWSAFTAAVDADGNASIEERELVTFFEDGGGADGMWNLAGPSAGPRSGPSNRPSNRPGAADERSGGWPSGPRVGTLAPDFTLAPPDGGAKQTLSAFRGTKPVALIFGSYT
jgi:hypothetical protein